MSINPTAYWVSDWVGRMAPRFGGILHDASGQRYDWGQALAREQYGPDWETRVPDAPTDADVQRARDWEAGHWPDWVVREEVQDARQTNV